MDQAPPLGDTNEYRRIFYEWVFNGEMVTPRKRDAKAGASRAPTPPSTADRQRLAEQVAADRADPRKAAMQAEGRRRAMERQEAAANGKGAGG